jgi:hypothetical protein
MLEYQIIYLSADMSIRLTYNYLTTPLLSSLYVVLTPYSGWKLIRIEKMGPSVITRPYDLNGEE